MQVGEVVHAGMLGFGLLMRVLPLLVSRQGQAIGSPRLEFKVVLGDQVFFGDAGTSAEARWALERRWQDLVAVTADETTTAADLTRAHERGWHTILAVNANPTELIRRAASRGRSATNLTAVLKTQLNHLSSGQSLTWEYLCEDDSSGTGFSYDLLKAARRAVVTQGSALSPAAAESLWDNYLHAALESTIEHTSGIELHRNAKFGFPSSAHAIARAGADTLVLERDNDDVGTLTVGTPFLRGAAAQYNLTWGIDLSLWWGVIEGCVNDLPASYHTRTLYMAYVSGASLVEIEGCGWLDTSSNGSRVPFPISNAVDQFGDFASHTLPAWQRGKSDAVVALLLPSDHGWDERPSWANTAVSWNYADLPTRRGGRSIDGIFSAAFPGTNRFSYFAFPFGTFGDGGPKDPPSPFARSAITPKYAPDKADVHYATSPLPFGVFKSRQAASAYMKSTRADPSSQRPMVDTRWGGIIDVVVAPSIDAAATERNIGNLEHALLHYRVAVVLGETVSPAIADLLHTFASQGGTVVIAAGSALPDHAESLTGVNFTGQVLASRAWTWIEENSETQSVHEPLLVAASTILKDSNTSILAVSLPGRHPQVTKRAIGQGNVYCCTVPWFEGAGRDLSELGLQLLDRIIAPIQPVIISGDGLPLEWTSTTRSDGSKIVALSNHAEGTWHGSIDVRTACKATMPSCRDLRHNTTCVARPSKESAGGVNISLTIPAYDVTVLELGCSHSRHKTDDELRSGRSFDVRIPFDVNLKFAGGTLDVDTHTGAFKFSVVPASSTKISWESAQYELWFEGKLFSTQDDSLRITNATHQTGADRLGKFELLEIHWVGSPRLSWVTAFRSYASGPIIFEQSFPLGWASGLGERSDIDTPATSFPSFRIDDTSAENLTVVTFRGQNAAQSTHYGRWPQSYRGGYLGGPVGFVDDILENAFVISPIDEFMIANHNIRNCHASAQPCTELYFGALGMLTQLSPGTTLPFVLSVSTAQQRQQSSVSYAGTVAASFMAWGDVLLRYHQKRRVASNASVVISSIGYSTTGIYHYNPCDCINNSDGESCSTSNPHLPGCKTYEDTLLAVYADAAKRNISYSWWLIDSWWHAYDNESYFEDVPQQVSHLFPRGLKWLANATDMSFSAHWSSKFGLASPYRKISPESWFCSEKECIPTDERVWDHIFLSDQAWRLQTIKVDHMLSTLVGSAADNGDGTCPGPRGWPYPGHECQPGERTALIRNYSEAVLPCLTSPSVAANFLTAIARSAARHHVSIEWCMSYPNVLMQSVATGDASTHARGSDDSHPVGAGTSKWDGTIGFTSNNWHGFAGESTWIWAIGLYPFKDTFYSNSSLSVTPQNQYAEDFRGHEPRPFTHALVAALSGGGVANGDPVGSTDAELLMLTCTKNGVLLKPTVPAMYIDRTWLSDQTVGETALGISNIPGSELSWRMIYSINSAGFELTATDVGVKEPALVYTYCGPRPLTRPECTGPAVRELQIFSGDGARPLRVPPAGPDLEAKYYLVAPAMSVAVNSLDGANVSWALLGEWPKLVPVSPQRFSAISITALALDVSVTGDPHEVVDVLAASGSAPHNQVASWVTLSVTCRFGPLGGQLTARWSLVASANIVSACE